MEQVTHGPALADQAYNIILEAIIGGQAALEEKLSSQEKIAQSLNVSRQPVLQAIGLLKAQGFLCNAGRRGLMVAPLDPGFVEDLYEFRSAVDRLAAGKAAQRCTPEHAAEGRLILRQGKAARKSGSLIELSLADMAFHQWVYAVAGNRTVTETMNHYWNHTRRAMCAVLSMHDKWPERVWSEHAAIHAAIKDRNSKLAERLAHVHVETASRALCDALQAKLRDTVAGRTGSTG
jgi:DNA-binding GntR family transcriptional regulator